MSNFLCAALSKFATAERPRELAPDLIAKIRRKSRSIDYSGADIRGYVNRFLSRKKQRVVREQYERYWCENNSKLRDDIYYQSRLEEAKALWDGRRDEAKKDSAAATMIRNVLALPAYRLLLENVNGKQRDEILAKYIVTGPIKRN